MNNVLKTAFLLTALTLLLLFFGQALGGRNGMMTAFVFACVMNFGAYWWSGKIVLAIYRAQPLPEEQAREIYAIVRELAQKATIPMPRIYVIPSAAPNAFATGRNPQHAVVAVTQGIFELLNTEELEGVLAHELAHVLHRDILTSSIAATLAGAISMLANMVRWTLMFGGSSREEERNANPVALLFMAILMPIAALLVQLAVSRSREYHADEAGARLCEHPLYLASALQKLENASRRFPMFQADPSSAHLFIVNPLRGRSFAALFGTHPPIEDRIARLERMERG